MKKVLIISPYFPPVNAADMQRVRMSLPYFSEFGWQAEVVTIDPKYTDFTRDELLLQSIPSTIKIHFVKAFTKSVTQIIGLGSIAIRSLWFYRQKVNSLLKADNYDLIYFSTTQFPVCILGRYWKKKFSVPYVIDMQDPWHSDYYEDKPKSEQPAKYWFSYRLNKYLEPKAIRHVGGLISVSSAYIELLKTRYTEIKHIPSSTIPFGFYKPDMDIARANQSRFKKLLSADTKNVVYVGRGGADMHQSIAPLFRSLQAGLADNVKAYKSLRFYFIGTSYAPAGQGRPSILPLAKQYGVEDRVIEITDRISFYHSLITLQQADALFVPGSDDPKYTASKLYPYLLTARPLLAIFDEASPALETLHKCGIVNAYSYQDKSIEQHIDIFLNGLTPGTLPALAYDQQQIDEYSALNMTRRQCALFAEVIG